MGLRQTLLQGFLVFGFAGLSACTTTAPADFPVAKDTVQAGDHVSMAGSRVDLFPGSLKVNEKLPEAHLANSRMEATAFAPKGMVSIVSIVPSIDTKVCEQQTHILGESTELAPTVKRITISRDLPMAQQRFAKEAKLTNIEYLSDYRGADFGRKTGLLMKGSELLARAVMVVDQEGVIRYLQVVPDVTQLPDMAKAIAVANSLVAK